MIHDDFSIVEQKPALIITNPQWECKMHGDQGDDSGVWVLGDNYCSQCFKDLLSRNMYPMKKKG